MKTAIYYFSGTGNSLAVAKTLTKQLGECELIPIARVWPQDRILADADRVGLVFPLYFWGLPNIVETFVRKLRVRESAYCFAVATRGWPIPGGAFRQLSQAFAASGATFHAGWYVTLPDNYILWANVPPEQKRQAMYAHADQKIRGIAEQICAQAHVIAKEPNAFLRPVVRAIFFNDAAASDRRFLADERCNGCGTCLKICPTQNITLTADSRPQWQHRCEQCLACLHFCPKQAIQYGQNMYKRARYHHPQVTLAEMICQNRTM